MQSLNKSRDHYPLPEDLFVFLTVIRQGSFASAAEELGQSPAYVSKRINILEKTLKTKLLHRTTRRISVTDDGERTRTWAEEILANIDNLSDELSQAHSTPSGFLHISCSLGFGRVHMAPAISELKKKYPELDIRLDLLDREVDIIQEGYDINIQIGDDIPNSCICKKLVSNKRILCASPEYLLEHGSPENIDDLTQHHCLVLKERNTSFGIWHLSDGENLEVAKINAPLSTNSGEVIIQWALDGQGIVLRSLWDVQPMLDKGELIQVLPKYYQEANIWAVYSTRQTHSAKLRVCVEFLQNKFKHISNKIVQL